MLRTAILEDDVVHLGGLEARRQQIAVIEDAVVKLGRWEFCLCQITGLERAAVPLGAKGQRRGKVEALERLSFPRLPLSAALHPNEIHLIPAAALPRMIAAFTIAIRKSCSVRVIRRGLFFTLRKMTPPSNKRACARRP